MEQERFSLGSRYFRLSDKFDSVACPSFSPPSPCARVHALHTCADPTLYDIQVSSCAGTNSLTLSPANVPGCAVVDFRNDGRVTRNFIHPGGRTCEISSGRAVISLPEPDRTGPHDGGSPIQVALGTFAVDCRGGDGTDLVLIGSFAVPMWWRQALC